MSTRKAFVVEVKGELREAPERVRDRLAELLHLSPEKAAALVARMPGVITKPLPEERAMRLVLRLQAAGLVAAHRRAEAPGGDPPAAAAPEPKVRHPTGFDQIPSLDATRVDEPVERPDLDQKLTPMSEAGFGAADIVLPVEPKRGTGSDSPSIVASGSVSRPMPRPPKLEPPPPEEADPTMVMPPDAEPGEAPSPAASPGEAPSAASSPGTQRSGRATGAPEARPNGASADAGVAGAPGTPRAGHGHTPAPSSRLRDAIARDRGGAASRPRNHQPEPSEERLQVMPSSDVAYRSTKSAAERALTLTPPPDEALRRGGVPEDQLASSRERRRGRFRRRLSAMVALPVTLSWLLSAGFIYLLLPSALRGELWVPLAAATAIAALAGALAAGLATAGTARDVERLRDDAERIAMGDLSVQVQTHRTDELGDVGAAIDRLRVSLHEALARLRKRH